MFECDSCHYDITNVEERKIANGGGESDQPFNILGISYIMSLVKIIHYNVSS